MSNILNEAFQALNILDEEVFDVTSDGITELQKFRDMDDSVETEVVIDPLASTEEELQDSYVGNVILDCSVCQSKIYKNPEEVIVSEDEELVNVGEICPYCQCSDGYKVIGQVEKIEKEDLGKDEVKETEVTVDETDIDLDESLGLNEALSDLDIKIKDFYTKYDPEEFQLDRINSNTTFRDLVNALNNGKDVYSEEVIGEVDSVVREAIFDKLSEILNVNYDTIYTLWLRGPEKAAKIEIKESISNKKGLKKQKSFKLEEADKPAAISIEDAQKWVDYDMKRYGKISDRTNDLVKKAGFQIIKSDHGQYEVAAGKFESMKESFEEVEVKTDKEKIKVETEGEKTKVEISPRDDFEEVEVEEESEEVISPLERETVDKFKSEDEDEFREVEITDIDEETFDELGESYLRKVYENVRSYKTTSGTLSSDKQTIKLEGVLTFKSGKKVKTNFIFEGKSISNNGTLKLIGSNKQFARGNKSFILEAKANKGKLISESLSYNYRGKDAISGDSKKVYGRVRLGR